MACRPLGARIDGHRQLRRFTGFAQQAVFNNLQKLDYNQVHWPWLGVPIKTNHPLGAVLVARNIQISPMLRRRRSSTWAGKFLPGLLGVVLLVLQSVLPVSARSSADWVEICGEFGAVLVQVDRGAVDPVDPTAPCPKCSDCAMCALTAFEDMPTAQIATVGDIGLISKISLPAYPDVAENAAQFWHESRGPPRQTPMIYETTIRLFLDAPHTVRRLTCS